MGIEPDFSVLLTELRSARETIGSHNKALTGRVDQIEKSVNEILLAQRRPGIDLGCELATSNAKAQSRMCVYRHDPQAPKRDTHALEYHASSSEIDDALIAIKAIRSLLRHGDVERLPAGERKSLSSFNFGNSGWILPPQMADRVLSCLVDQTNISSLMGQAVISAGSIIFPLDNVDLTDSVGWACEANCAVNQASPDLYGLGQLEIKAETIRRGFVLARRCSPMLRSTWNSGRCKRPVAPSRRRSRAQFICGTGVGMPVGILNPNSGIPVRETAPSTAAGQIDRRDLVARRFELPEQTAPGRVF